MTTRSYVGQGDFPRPSDCGTDRFVRYGALEDAAIAFSASIDFFG
jgi:hypothetical protein